MANSDWKKILKYKENKSANTLRKKKRKQPKPNVQPIDDDEGNMSENVLH
jgi:hypothetical protein